MAFLSVFSISAKLLLSASRSRGARRLKTYVLPSYSNTGSHPMHGSQVKLMVTHGNFLPKSAGPRAGTIFPWNKRCPISILMYNNQCQLFRLAYRTATLEEDGLLTRTSRVAERTDRFRGLVGVCSKEIVQPFVTDSCQEPLAFGGISTWEYPRAREDLGAHMYGPGRPPRAL